MAAVHTPRTPRISSVEQYVNPAFTTDSLEDEANSPSPSPSPSPQKYTFTPQRVSKPPRAWERKLATPFAPRTEGQRIWKRVPLGDTQGNSKVADSRGSQEGRGLKVLKKLRKQVNEQENAIYVSTKWDEAQEIVRRKISQSINEPLEIGQVGESLVNDAPEMSIVDTEPLSTGSDEDRESPSTPEDHDEIQDGDETLEHGHIQDQQDESSASLTVTERNLVTEPSILAEDSPTIDVIEPIFSDQDPAISDTTMQLPEEPTKTEVMLEELIESSPQQQATIVSDKSPIRTPEAEAKEEGPLEEPIVEKSPQRQRRRSSLAAVFTGSGLVCPPEPANESTGTSIDQTSAQPTATANDDTAFLHEFLTRARAQKAAKSSSPEKPRPMTPSPVKKRQALAPLNKNSPSPSKTEKVQLHPDEMAEETLEVKVSSPCRRSGRTRLPRPQKAITTIPSNIPVRRSNGTEFIFLQRTEAQETALATRANTQRNKGDALHPKYKLPYINNSLAMQSPLKSPRKRKAGKGVSWDEQLTRFSSEDADESEEKLAVATVAEVQETSSSSMDSKPKARKMRRLGTVNGTPAPKRTFTEDGEPQSQIPGRKLRSREKK